MTGSTGPIFTIFSPNERYFREFSRPGPFFILLGTFPWQPILSKNCEMTFIHHARILQKIQISQFRFSGDKGHTLCRFLPSRPKSTENPCVISGFVDPSSPKLHNVPFNEKIGLDRENVRKFLSFVEKVMKISPVDPEIIWLNLKKTKLELRGKS